MGLFDRSKSTTTQTAYTENTQQNVNVQDSEGALVLSDIAGGVTFTDSGAVDSAFDFADSFGGKALDVLSQSTERSFATLGNAITQAGDAARNDTTDTFRRVALYAAVAAAVIVVAMMFRKGG